MSCLEGDELELLIDALTDPLLACDGREHILYITPAAERLLGWKGEELRGQPFSLLVPPRLQTLDGNSLLRYLLARQQQQPGHSTLLPLKRRGGEELLLEITTGQAQRHGQQRIVLSLRRAPEAPSFSPEPLQQEVSLELWQSGHLGAARKPDMAERRYQTIVENAPLGIFHFDKTPVITACNDYFVRITGSSKQLLIGLNLLTLKDPRITHCISATLSGKHSHYEGDYASVTASKVTPVRIHFAPCHDGSGQVAGGVGIVEDITERKKVEREHARLFREAQEAVRVREDFLTIASHELKTPLTPLSLRLANLERRLERGEPVDPSSLRHARQHLLRLTSLINDLLDASRIESGGLALQPQPTRLDLLTEHVIHVTEGLYEAGHRILFHAPATPLQVLGDPYRLEQVIANLLENALKYSPDGGTIHVSLEPRGDTALLSVSDPGIGIPADQQEHLFERYFRARNVSPRSYGGLGLGLYICRDIVARHGGRIWVESEVDRGSTFYVALPTLPSAQAQPEQASSHTVH
ncbi:ATP-binding protein [Hyalangium minutum]|uniref:histidine kinase n=1 Tax=Hyalangium minutum TaxID=394096 RepID=A0A085WTM1_9BACT|nr:ATP-binding protein [Hyalangium minutum]KFE71034.1 sensory box histidine kinase [Hyalangium minutum]